MKMLVHTRFLLINVFPLFVSFIGVLEGQELGLLLLTAAFLFILCSNLYTINLGLFST